MPTPVSQFLYRLSLNLLAYEFPIFMSFRNTVIMPLAQTINFPISQSFCKFFLMQHLHTHSLTLLWSVNEVSVLKCQKGDKRRINRNFWWCIMPSKRNRNMQWSPVGLTPSLLLLMQYKFSLSRKLYCDYDSHLKRPQVYYLSSLKFQKRKSLRRSFGLFFQQKPTAST